MAQKTSGSSYRIVPLAREHLDGAVEMHMIAFKGFFLAFLGRGFIRETYKNSIGHEQTVSYVAVNENKEVVGVALGYVDCKAYYRDIMRRKWWAFAFRAMWGIIRRPSIILRILRSLKHEGNIPPCDIKPLGSLPSIAVRPDAQGSGIGKVLMYSICDEFVRRGVHAVFLTTDRADNDRVRGFYSALEWDLLGYYTAAEGREMCWYLWQDPAVKKEIKEIVGE